MEAYFQANLDDSRPNKGVGKSIREFMVRFG
jgi:hypothetical protein